MTLNDEFTLKEYEEFFNHKGKLNILEKSIEDIQDRLTKLEYTNQGDPNAISKR